jgi:hypothetical protein
MTRCNVNYIGLLGMQVSASPRVILMHPKGTRLEVELTLNTDNGSEQCKLPAIVTNRSNGGIGLTFMNNHMHTNAVLMDIILSLSEHATVPKLIN